MPYSSPSVMAWDIAVFVVPLVSGSAVHWGCPRQLPRSSPLTARTFAPLVGACVGFETFRRDPTALRGYLSEGVE